MKVIEKGHSYELDNFHNEFEKDYYEQDYQILKFVKRVPIEDKNLETEYNGTTIREVLKACYRCVGDLDELLPCEENDRAMFHIAHAIEFLNKRERNRRKRGVHGKHLL